MLSGPELFVYQNVKKVSALYTAVSTQASLEAIISRVGGYFAKIDFILIFLHRSIHRKFFIENKGKKPSHKMTKLRNKTIIAF